jgi:flagellar hook-length control protein FliK
MPALPITPPTPARVGTAPKGASPPPGNAAPPTHFAALLDQTSARTASAEGPKNRPAQTEPRRRDAAAPKGDDQGTAAPDAQAAATASPAQPVAEPPQGQTHAVTDASVADPAQAVAASTQGQTPGGETPAAPVAPVVDPAAVAAVPTAAPAPAPALAPAVAPIVTPNTAATATVTAVAAQAAAGAGTTTAQPASADGGTPADASAAPTDGASGGKLQIPAELLDAKAGAGGGNTKDFKNGDQPRRDLPPAPTLPPTAAAAAAPAVVPAAVPAAPTPPVDAAVAIVPAPTAAAVQAQPAATLQTAVPVANGGVGGPVLSRASVLQTAERVQELVRIVTTRAGNARAILQLRPAELGQVDVHLRTTRNGLVATISAHEQVGLDAMHQAGNELRRTLEDKGVQLHSLDLQLGDGRHDFSNQGDAREANSGRRGAAATHDLGSDDPVAEDELTITHAPSTPAGALVDVQA